MANASIAHTNRRAKWEFTYLDSIIYTLENTQLILPENATITDNRPPMAPRERDTRTLEQELEQKKTHTYK